LVKYECNVQAHGSLRTAEAGGRFSEEQLGRLDGEPSSNGFYPERSRAISDWFAPVVVIALEA
jgi:hypothetical protein